MGEYSKEQLLDPPQALLDNCDPAFVGAVRRAAVTLRDEGNYQKAEQILLQIGAAQEQVHGAEDVESLRITFELACVQSKQGRHEEAESSLCHLLSTRQKILGREHPHSVNTMTALAEVYRIQDRLDEAAPMMEEAFSIVQADATTSNHRYHNIVNNLALIYHEQERLEEARDLFEQSLHDGEDEHSPGNLDQLNIMDNLAHAYQELGQIAQAEDLFKRAFTMRVQAWGSEHPETLESMIQFARFFEHQNRWDEAHILHQRVLNAKEAHHGSDHLETHISRCGVARSLIRMKGYSEATNILEKVLSAKSLFLDDEDISVQITFLHAQHGLAICHHEQQYHAEAAEQYELSLRGLEDRIGKDHSSLSSILCSYGRLQRDENRLSEARKLFSRCLAIVEQDLASREAENRKTSATKDDLYPECVLDLAECFEDLGLLEEAESTFHKALEFSHKYYQPSSPVSVSIMVNLGMYYGNHDRFQEEIDMMLPALSFRQSHFGQTHQSIIYPLRGLALANYMLRRFEEALPYFEQAISIMDQEWGVQDSRTKEFVILYLKVLNSIGGMQLVEEKDILDRWVDQGVTFRVEKDDVEDEVNTNGTGTADAAPNENRLLSFQGEETKAKPTDQTFESNSQGTHPSRVKL